LDAPPICATAAREKSITLSTNDSGFDPISFLATLGEDDSSLPDEPANEISLIHPEILPASLVEGSANLTRLTDIPKQSITETIAAANLYLALTNERGEDWLELTWRELDEAACADKATQRIDQHFTNNSSFTHTTGTVAEGLSRLVQAGLLLRKDGETAADDQLLYPTMAFTELFDRSN
jgi:hypothetical protein